MLSRILVTGEYVLRKKDRRINVRRNNSININHTDRRILCRRKSADRRIGEDEAEILFYEFKLKYISDKN